VNAAEATVEAINKSGAAGDKTVNLKICDTKQNANTLAACGTQAVQDDAVAVVSLSTSEAPYEAQLQQAGIPDFGFMLDPVMLTSPIAYSVVDAGSASDIGILALAKKDSCSRIVEVRADPEPPASVQASVNTFLTAAQNVVKIPANVVLAEPGTPDMSPYIAKAVSYGGNCLYVVGFGSDFVALMKAVEQTDPSHKLRILTAPSLVSPGAIDSLGLAFTDRLQGVQFAWDTSAASQKAHPGVKEFVDTMKEYAHSPYQLDDNSEAMWGDLNLIAHVVSQVHGKVSAASVAGQLNKVHDYDPGVGPVVSFDTRPQAPVPPRRFAPYSIAVEWVGGVLKTTGEFFNVYTGKTVS
jgi:ABC-type branched-subunit amino acid transport system substrate-binding protein